MSPTVGAGVHTLVTVNAPSATISFLEVTYFEFADPHHLVALDDLMFQNGAAPPQIGLHASGEVWMYTSDGTKVTADEGITIGRFAGSTGPVTLAVSGLPAGVSGAFASNPFNGAGGVSDPLTLSAPQGMPGQPFMNVTVTATPSVSAGTNPVSTSFPLHVVNGYGVANVGISLSQTAFGVSPPSGPAGVAPQVRAVGGSASYDGDPLLGGAATVAHVFVDPVGLITPGSSRLSVRLYGYRGNALLSGSPLSANPLSPPNLGDQSIAVAAGKSGTSFDFTLPPAWSQGSITLIADVTGPRATAQHPS